MVSAKTEDVTVWWLGNTEHSIVSWLWKGISSAEFILSGLQSLLARKWANPFRPGPAVQEPSQGPSLQEKVSLSLPHSCAFNCSKKRQEQPPKHLPTQLAHSSGNELLLVLIIAWMT